MLSDELNYFYLLVSLVLLAIGTLAGLAASILYLRRPRVRHPAQEWIGHPLDVSRLNPTLRQVRDDYVQALRSRPHPQFHAAPLIETARQSILQLDYFQEKEEAS